MVTSLSKPAGGLVRVFFGIGLPASIQAAVTALHPRLARFREHLKVVAPESLHLTVRFLGEVTVERCALSEQVADEVTRASPAFRLRLSSVGTFPGGNRTPRVIWIGLQRDAGLTSLQRLAARLDDALATRGFPRESRAYSPHLTVARVRDGLPQDVGMRLHAVVDRLALDRSFPEGLEVSSITLMRSDLGSEGPTYTPLKEFSLSCARVPDVLSGRSDG